MTHDIAIVGSGYVGTVVAACLAKVGHRVTGIEVDPEKLASLKAGKPYFYEPGLEDLLAIQVQKGNLVFTNDAQEALDRSSIVLLCVGTPSNEDGNADLGAVEGAVREMGPHLDDHIVVTKSTVPIGTGIWLQTVLEEVAPRGSFTVASNPEFLRQGSAVRDYLHPDRVVIGCDDPDARVKLIDMYKPILEQSFAEGDPDLEPALVATGITTAETIKYAANAFLATKISFINEIAQICQRVGAEVPEVAAAMGLDPRIGGRFLRAGIGWGGSCFGKDIDALTATASDYGYETKILKAAREVNKLQSGLAVEALQRALKTLRGRRIALLGLTFKPDTDDMREAPALGIARQLINLGAIVTAYDPVVHKVPELGELRTAPDAYTAMQGADATVLVTEWPEFSDLDYERAAQVMSGDLFFDGRNVADPHDVLAAGLRYHGIGRGATSDWFTPA